MKLGNTQRHQLLLHQHSRNDCNVEDRGLKEATDTSAGVAEVGSEGLSNVGTAGTTKQSQTLNPHIAILNP